MYPPKNGRYPALGGGIPCPFLRGDAFDSLGKIVGMVVAVGALKHLNRHAKIACRRPQIDPALHEPSCRRVPHGMRGDGASRQVDLGFLDHRPEGFLDRYAVPLDEMLLGDAKPVRAP